MATKSDLASENSSLVRVNAYLVSENIELRNQIRELATRADKLDKMQGEFDRLQRDFARARETIGRLENELRERRSTPYNPQFVINPSGMIGHIEGTATTSSGWAYPSPNDRDMQAIRQLRDEFDRLGRNVTQAMGVTEANRATRRGQNVASRHDDRVDAATQAQRREQQRREQQQRLAAQINDGVTRHRDQQPAQVQRPRMANFDIESLNPTTTSAEERVMRQARHQYPDAQVQVSRAVDGRGRLCVRAELTHQNGDVTYIEERL